MSGNTNEIRTDVNAILDCIDYVCQRLDISQEELDKAVKFVEDEVLTPGIKLAMKKVLDDRVGKNRYVWNPIHRQYEKPKIPHTAKDDWSYELDHLYFDNESAARRFIDRIEDYVNDNGEITVECVLAFDNKLAPYYDASLYGWSRENIKDRMKYMRNAVDESVKVILPPPVRLKY